MSATKTANAAMATPAQPRQMSSRLLTMKFMQRASNGTSSPLSPSSEPAHKRRKTDHTPESSAPTTPADEIKNFASRSDVKAALQAESRRERLAAEQRAALGYSHDMFESQWVLDASQPLVTADNILSQNLDASQSSESESEDEWIGQGRQSYGGFKRSKIKNAPSAGRTTILDSDSEEASSAGSDSDADSPNQRSAARRPRQNPDADDDAAMAALDRVDLTKSSYAKAKGTMAPARPFNYGESRRDRRGEKHPKKKRNKAHSKAKKY